MKNVFLATVLALGAMSLSQAATLPFPDVPAAKQAAKEQGKPALVIWHGSDWMHDSAKLCAGWNKLAGMGLPVVLGQYDDCLGQEGDSRNKVLPIECYNLPVAVLLAPDGTFMHCFSVADTSDPAKLATGVRQLLPKVAQFSELAATARGSQGVAAAEAAGKALDLMPLDGALRNTELKNIIFKQDEADATGYRALYAMDHLAMYREINLLLNHGESRCPEGMTRDFAAAEAYVRKALANAKLQGERRQQWLAGLYYIQKELACESDKPDFAPVLATLGEIIAIDPNSQTGKGAAKYREYWDPGNFYTIKNFYYESGDQTFRREKEWHVDVTSCIDGAGEYTFRLVPAMNGAMSTRDFRLAVDGKEVATALGTDANTNTKTVDFSVPELPKGAKVEVYLRAQCFDGWFGCSGSIEMKKK